MSVKKVLALLLGLALICSLVTPALAEGEDEAPIIHISTPEQLCELAEKCTLDSFSVGKTVVLDNDIDLSGVDFYPIPTFSGSFDGRKHTIYNMKTATDGSHQGLFRYLQAEGTVSNLSVTGSVTPKNSRCMVGGIVGTNYGTISACSFEGDVAGLSSVGGIAGENFGLISACTSKGKVSGKQFTGGIAGHSTGLITGCVNFAQINTSLSEAGLNLEDLDISEVINPKLKSASDSDVTSDSGGIAGYSSGSIISCTNRGAVGYPHYGYNIGGVAGRHSGYINLCANYGQVYGRMDVGGIVGQMEPFLLLKTAVSLSGELYTLQSLTAKAMGNLSGMSREMQEALEKINSSSGSAADKITDGSNPDGTGDTTDPGTGTAAPDPGTADPGTGTADPGTDPGTGDPTDPGTGGTFPQIPGIDVPGSIAGDLTNMADGMNELVSIMSVSTGNMANDLVDVSRQLSRVLIMMANLISGADMTTFQDVSEQMREEEETGRVSRCVNHGSIDGDSNVGGIAGTMGIELGFDLEGKLSEMLGIGNILSSTYLEKCVSSHNINRGAISAKRDNCGGVTGLEDVGTIYGCEGYGSVKSLDGGCVGGIVGRSKTSVKDSYAMCSLDGNEYVGGIAGYGSRISGCRTLIGVGDVTACCGAIAGWADMTVEGAVQNNTYVHERLGAVDGISYSGRAAAISYDELMNTEDLPGTFRKLKLSFMADGRLVKALEFMYGSDLDTSRLPDVPEKAGYSGRWPDYDYTDLRFSDTIEAIYVPRQAAVAASTQRGDSPMSILLLEGDFEDGARLDLVEYTGEAPELTEGTVLEKWVLHLENTSIPSEGYTVRYLTPEDAAGRTDIYLYSDGEWNKVDTERRGSYVTFSCTGDTAVFCAVETEQDSTPTITAAVLAAIALFAFAYCKRRKSAAYEDKAINES